MKRDLIPTSKPKPTGLRPVQKQEIVKQGEIVHTSLVERRHGTVIEHRAKPIKVSDAEYLIDHESLCRAVKQITQTIGEYKRMDNAYSHYVIPAMRKARSDMVSDLESHFGIHWEIDENGRSRFFT